MTKKLYYAGIGSRETPPEVYKKMVQLGARLAKLGFILRSGAAPGADTAFEEGCVSANGQKEIYLPWRGFNQNTSQLFNQLPGAVEIASMTHPGWAHCSPAAKKLHSRNVHQVLGRHLDHKSEFVVCWTQDGCEHGSRRSRATGGTGQAISIASGHDVKIYNLFNPDSEARLEAHIRKLLNVGYVRVTNVRRDMFPDGAPEEGELVIPIHRDNPILGNPHVLKNKDDQREREKVIHAYENDLIKDIAARGPKYEEIERIADLVVGGHKVCLECFCKPRDCHGDPLVKAINRAVDRKLNPIEDAKPQEPVTITRFDVEPGKFKLKL